MILRQRLAFGLAGVLALVFVFLAAWRRLNFDEALVLRAGVLELAGADTAPAFLMPWTLAVGALAAAVGDPGRLFLLARLAAAVPVLALLAVAFLRSGLSGTRLAAAGALTLAQAAFVAHGFEFRYDTAILLGLLAVTAALASADRPWPALAGVALAWLALHHLKGLYFAAVLSIWAVAVLRRRRGALGRCAAAAAGLMLVWGIGLASAGLGGRWLETLRQFGALSREVSRVSLAESLGAVFARDLAWWMLALGGLVAVFGAARRAALGPGERALLLPAFAALLLVVLHPHAWAYMLALPAPFLAGLVALQWPRVGERPGGRRLWFAAGAFGLLLQVAVLHRSPVAPWRNGLAAPRAPIVEVLRGLRAAARPGERVLDPAGLVYFLPPCNREWYVDGLFAEKVRRGTWMSELAKGLPADCTWVVATYRLQAVPPAVLEVVRGEFRFFPSGIGLRFPDPAGSARSTLAPLDREAVLDNYW